ncbi:Aldo/keto reductase [Obba rivulosa]|uniref:Aldo/keto reductase n=1 Tax=Obba rivulosa TaxID=1052685 RepID=A0A8E2AM29_9APHY|nr:Aldo/keto reductase [Obba rivulosa]
MSLQIATSVSLSSGYEMPLLGLGVFRNYDCFPACLAALKHGYRHIDSARVYGNEEDVGRAVCESGVPREQVFITSKIRFGLDYLDLFLIHDPLSGKEKRLDTWRALIECRNAGKIHTIGVSNYNVNHLEEIREAGLETPAVNQFELQPFCQQKPIVEYCRAHGIVIQAYCPLIRGNLDHPFLQEMAKKYNKNVPQVLVRWSLQHGFSPLPKSSDPARVISNASVYDFEISPEDMARIDALDRGKDGAVSWNPVDVD